MELIDNPAFWECLGVLLILIFSVPVVYLMFLVCGAACLVWKHGGFSEQPQAQIFDPKFGELQLFANRGWAGEFTFSPSGQRVGISFCAAEAGPTDEQKLWVREIEAGYNDVLPEIHRSLSKYTADAWDAPGWEFDLIEIEIPSDPHSQPWIAQFVANTEEDGDMAYFVAILNSTVRGVDAAD